MKKRVKIHSGYAQLRRCTKSIKDLEKDLASTGVRYFDISLKKTLDEINSASQKKFA